VGSAAGVQTRVQSGVPWLREPLSPIAYAANVSPAFTNVNPMNRGESFSASFSLFPTPSQDFLRGMGQGQNESTYVAE